MAYQDGFDRDAKVLRTGVRRSWDTLGRAVARARTTCLLACLLVIIVISGHSAERVGDRVQVFLPLAGLGCAALQGQGVTYFGRYVLLEAGIKIPKFMLGDHRINQRPDGGRAGFPSGHTAAATFGAVGLMQTCLKSSKPAQAVVVLAAGFTGGSRIDAGRHNVWQVLAGAVLGWGLQVLALARFDRGFRSLVRAIGGGVSRLRIRVRRRLRGLPQPPVFLGLALAWMLLAEPGHAEMELSLYTGSQIAGNSRVSGSDPAGVGGFSFLAGWEGRSFDAPPYYGVRGTWWRSERFGWWLDFTHNKIYADPATLAASGFPELEFTDGLNTVTVGPVWRWPRAGSRWRPYAGFGVGLSIPYVEVQTQAGGPLTESYQVVGPALSWAGGVAYAIDDRWSLFGEYKGTYNWIDADLDGGGSVSTAVDTHAINIGVTFRLN